MNPLEAFPGGADEARAFVESARLFVLGGGPGTTMAKQMSAVFDLALAHLDSLAADPEREAKVEESLDNLIAAAYQCGDYDRSDNTTPQGMKKRSLAIDAARKVVVELLRPALAASNANARGGE